MLLPTLVQPGALSTPTPQTPGWQFEQTSVLWLAAAVFGLWLGLVAAGDRGATFALLGAAIVAFWFGVVWWLL